LVTLVLQNSALVLVMHYSRTSTTTPTQPRYLVSTAVLLVEVIKLLTSLVLATRDIRNSHPDISISHIPARLCRSVFAPDCWKLILPAALYTLQNSLVYVAVTNLEAVTFQVTYQLKILTTVLFSILLLGRSISSREWLSLLTLTGGIALMHMAAPHAVAPSSQSWKERLASLSQFQTHVEPIAPVTTEALKGLVAVLSAAVISGLTCVYFEKLVKDSLAEVSLWTRNVQLSFFSLFPAFFIGVLWQDGVAVGRDGFFAGYSPVVWLTVALQAFGGLVVAVCIAYTDNVAKNFASCLSIVVSYAAGAVVFGTPLRMHSTSGAAVVLIAMYLYTTRPAVRPLASLPGSLREKGGVGEPAPRRVLYPLTSIR